MSTPEVCVIGASNIDITGYAYDRLTLDDSNRGYLTLYPGGVGRNIAENLNRLQVPVRLVSLFGDDLFGKFLLDDCNKKGIDTLGSIEVSGRNNAAFLAVMNEENDLAAGIAAMDIYDSPPDAFVRSAIRHCSGAGWVVIETNLPENVLERLISSLPHARFVLDTVSGDKALRAKKLLPHLHILKTNLLEARILAGKPDAEASELTGYFLETGVTTVYITCGKQGVVFGNASQRGSLPPVPVQVVNTTGAGDSFVAGITYAEIRGAGPEESAATGLACAALTVQSRDAVSPALEPGAIAQYLRSYR